MLYASVQAAVAATDAPKPASFGSGRLPRLRRYRRRALPYLAAALLSVVGLSLFLDSAIATAPPSSSHRLLSAALPGESCEESHLNSFELENKAFACLLYVPLILYMFLGVRA